MSFSHPREILTKPKYKASSIKLPLERRYRQNTRQGSDTLPSHLPPVSSHLPPASAPRRASPERATHEDMDSGSDISDTERISQVASTANPPLLNLREEVIDPSDFQPSHALSRSHAVSRDRYPDFLPPPLNSWNLRELAVYLNTEGKNVPRSRPVNQFERYLNRLLQLEWRQILTLHEESSKSTWTVRRRPHSSLSAPKSILQCQRAFALTLLSSVHPQSCCSRYSVSVCMNPHRSHPLTEKSRFSRRSNSETRAYRLNRLNDSSLDHLKRMQAIGNIRNPSPHNLHVNSPMGLDPLRRRSSGGRSRACGDDDEDGCRPERRSEACNVFDSKSSTGSEKEQGTGRTSVKHKHVEFVFRNIK